ncbi:MAG: ribonuclease P protein component [bacterium]
MKRERLDRGRIIKRSDEFNEIFSQGRRVSSAHFVLFVTDNDSLKYGFAVSRRMGGAVKRNYAKRRLREILKLNQDLLPEDKRFILLAKPGVERQRFKHLNDEFVRLVKKVRALNLR